MKDKVYRLNTDFKMIKMTCENCVFWKIASLTPLNLLLHWKCDNPTVNKLVAHPATMANFGCNFWQPIEVKNDN